MQHSSIVNKSGMGIVFTKAIGYIPEITVWKLSNNFILSKIININFVILLLEDDYYKCGFVVPNEDCYLCIKFGEDVNFIRVGNPTTVILHYAQEKKQIKFKQIDVSDGRIIVEDILTELSDGFYYKKPSSIVYSVIEINSGNSINSNVLKIPYPSYTTIEPGTGDGFSALSNFIYVEKLAMLGFLGIKNSGFDRVTGKWIPTDTIVKAIDLGRAICHRYSLDWEKSSDNEENWIGNIIKYIKTQDNMLGGNLSYRPGVTPDNNKNNFELIQEDILGNVVVRGLSIYLSKPLETILTNEGAIIDFKNSSI